MNNPIQIGRSYREWWFLALIALSVCLTSASAMLFIVKHPLAPMVLFAGGIAGFSAAMSVLLIRKSRFQVEIVPGGFIVRSRRDEREFSDDQVICASLTSAGNYVNGVLKSTTRAFDVWVEGAAGAEQFKMVNRLAVGARDPLAPLVERVLAHLYERAQAALDVGEPFEGEGWTLHRNELVVHARRTAETVRFDALAAADVFDDHVCVWRHGQDEPVLRIPISSANTQILLNLLKERIVPNFENGETPPGDRLGRILFERKPGRMTFGLLWLVPLCGLFALAVVTFVAGIRGIPNPFLAGLPIGIIFGLFWVFAVSRCIEFRVHEHGVRRKWLFKTQQLKYADVDSFTYSAVRQYVKGVYSGTNFTLTFAWLAGKKLKKLTYARSLRNADADLEHLRDHVSQVIANRMASQFAKGHTVMWTEGLRFLPEGLEFRASGFFGRKAPVVYPYSQILGHDANLGTFWLWIHGTKKPVVKENISLPNFYPGYVFLTRLLTSRPAAAEPAMSMAPGQVR